MKAVAKRLDGAYQHEVLVRQHRLLADEPPTNGGHDTGPTPLELLAAALASCSAITLEMYAKRKGWDVGNVEVEVEFEPAQRGAPTRFDITVKLPRHLSEEQQERLMQIVAKCPVHRTLEGEAMFREELKLV